MRRSVPIAVASAGASVAIYLLVVVLTSPNVPPSFAVRAALNTNYLFILALAAGYGVFFFTTQELKLKGCSIKARSSAGVGTGASGFAALLSYLSLTHFGCCGFWIYVMSLLPSVVGVGASTLLIEYQNVFAALALIPLYYVTATRIRLLAGLLHRA